MSFSTTKLKKGGSFAIEKAIAACWCKWLEGFNRCYFVYAHSCIYAGFGKSF